MDHKRDTHSQYTVTAIHFIMAAAYFLIRYKNQYCARNETHSCSRMHTDQPLALRGWHTVSLGSIIRCLHPVSLGSIIRCWHPVSLGSIRCWHLYPWEASSDVCALYPWEASSDVGTCIPGKHHQTFAPCIPGKHHQVSCVIEMGNVYECFITVDS
jgi:hypothetical protein